MPIPESDYETIKARVKQKIATEAEWLLVEDELGPLFEGEQANVIDDNGIFVNFKMGDGVRKFSELPYSIFYYDFVQSQKKLVYLNQNTNITISSVFRDKSNLYDLIFVNNSGAEFPVRIGTTDGGNEIAEFDIPVGASTIHRGYYFTAPTPVYITGLDGKPYSLIILYYQYDESPVIPPAGGTGGGGSMRYLKGTGPLPFTPLYEGHLEEVWNTLTGRGNDGSGYENCMLTDFAGAPLNMAGKYLVGRKPGESIGVSVGNSDNTAPISMVNLPAQGVGMFVDSVVTAENEVISSTDRVARSKNSLNTSLNYEMNRPRRGAAGDVGVTANLGSGIEMNIQPDSITALYFIAIE